MRIPWLLLLGYAAVILILLVSGAFIVDRVSRDLEATIARNAETLAASLMDEVDHAIRDRIRTLRAFAQTDPVLHDAIRASNAEFEALGPPAARHAEVEARDKRWPRSKAEPETPFMLKIRTNAASNALRRTTDFNKRVQGSEVFAEIFVTNRYGGNVAQTGRTEDYNQADETWWQSAWDRGLWIAREVEDDPSAGVLALDIGVRVSESPTSHLGVLKAVLNVSVLREIIDGFGDRSRLENAYIELLDSSGRLIHRQNESRAIRTDLSTQHAVKALKANQEGTLVERGRRGEVLRAYVRSPPAVDMPSMGWSLILNQPTEAVHAPLHALKRWSLGVGIVGALVAGLIGLLISWAFGRMTQRLRNTGEALRQSEAQVGSILTSVVDGIVTMSPQGRLETVNPATEHIFGYTARELIGRNVDTLMPEPHRSQHEGYLRRYMETGEAHILGTTIEVEGIRKDGTRFPLDLAVSEIREGDSHRFVGIMRDVSERHAAQQATEAAKDAAEAASEAKSQFLANMSHELRTPLNAIIGYSEMVEDELTERRETELVADVDKIRSAGRHLLGLINDILDLSKIEAGKLDVYNEVFDLGDLLVDVADTVRPMVDANGNEFEVSTGEGLDAVYSDITKIRQILANLLSNAAKFTRDGRVSLSALREPGEPHDWMVFEVRDTGIGMSPEQIASVWDAFTQADVSTTREFGGTGLGLTITRRFTEMLHGTASIESRVGEGTTFVIRLPAATGPEDAPVHAESAVVAPEATIAAGETVLVIDDDRDARELLRRFLGRDGLDVLEAANGEEGLALARERRPSVIILDVMMPDMDGWAVLAALRAEPELADTPVVMLTMVQERGLGFALGVDAYLTKPVDHATLAKVLAPYRIEPSKHTILVVEDDAETRAMVSRVLRKDGWRVDEAEHGRDALARLEARRPDLILLDLMMPVMDGFQVVDAMRNDERWRDIPVVIVTAKDLAPLEADHLQGLVQEILQKGEYSRDGLLSEVRRYVRQALQRRRGPTTD